MKYYRSIFLSLMLVFFVSCISEEPLNPEADIEAFVINPDDLSSNTVIDQANRKILLYLKPEAFQNGVSPMVQTTKGASVSPASGTKITFENSVFYTVKSESGENEKKYEIEVVEIGNWTFNFET